MKMDASNDYSTGNGRIANQPNKPTRDGKEQPSPKDIGREFVRQYYTMLSERPQDVFRFYSHESFFMHGSEDPIQGQQNIQKAIENLQFVDCKARIHTVNGTSTVGQGLVIQVCGELSIRKEAGRRFLQTFILCPQTPKKYYVHNDIFQWLDQAFGHENREGRSESESPSAAGSGYVTDMNGVNSVVTNGQEEDMPRHNGHHPQHEPTTSDSTGLSHVPANGPTMSDVPAPTDDGNDMDTGVAEDDDRLAPPSLDKEPIAQESPTVPEVPVEPEPPAPTGPMTWASRVSARPSVPTKTASVVASVPLLREAPAQLQQRTPAPPAAAQQQHGSSADVRQERLEPTDPVCKLYLGSILRTTSPKNPQDCEVEIKKVFQQFGPVYSVRVPRKAIDETLQDDQGRLAAGFAFIIMETKEGSEKAYAACQRDDKGRQMLHVDLPSFGYSGPAALSQQDGDRRGGSASQRGGYNGGQGGGRPGGNYGGGTQQNQYMGGGGQRGGRGGMQSSGGYRGGSSGSQSAQRGGGASQFSRPRPPRNPQP